MLEDLTKALAPLGLRINRDKLPSDVFEPNPWPTAPGKRCQSEVGWSYLGRWMLPGESTDIDLEKKLEKGFP